MEDNHKKIIFFFMIAFHISLTQFFVQLKNLYILYDIFAEHIIFYPFNI